MKKTRSLLWIVAIFMMAFVAACGARSAPPTEAAPTIEQVLPTDAPQVVVEPTLPPPPTAQTFAPACQSAVACTAPALSDLLPETTYCVQKVAYQNIFIDPGVAFEVLDPANLTCADNGAVVNGKRVIECRGTQLWTTQIKFTNTACSVSTNLVAGSSQCQEGLGYDAAQNCCAPLTGSDTGSVTITVNMGGCP